MYTICSITCHARGSEEEAKEPEAPQEEAGKDNEATQATEDEPMKDHVEAAGMREEDQDAQMNEIAAAAPNAEAEVTLLTNKKRALAGMYEELTRLQDEIQQELASPSTQVTSTPRKPACKQEPTSPAVLATTTNVTPAPALPSPPTPWSQDAQPARRLSFTSDEDGEAKASACSAGMTLPQSVEPAAKPTSAEKEAPQQLPQNGQQAAKPASAEGEALQQLPQNSQQAAKPASAQKEAVQQLPQNGQQAASAQKEAVQQLPQNGPSTQGMERPTPTQVPSNPTPPRANGHPQELPSQPQAPNPKASHPVVAAAKSKPTSNIPNSSAINKRLSRIMEPNSKGVYKVSQAIRDQYNQGGEEKKKVLKLFASCGNDPD